MKLDFKQVLTIEVLYGVVVDVVVIIKVEMIKVVVIVNFILEEKLNSVIEVIV